MNRSALAYTWRGPGTVILACTHSLILSACGKESASAPTPAAPTVSSLTITGFDAVRTGFFSDYTATAR